MKTSLEGIEFLFFYDSYGPWESYLNKITDDLEEVRRGYEITLTPTRTRANLTTSVQRPPTP